MLILPDVWNASAWRPNARSIRRVKLMIPPEGYSMENVLLLLMPAVIAGALRQALLCAEG